MITKFKNIKNLAVFQDFVWDNNLRDEGNNVILFKSINILYGRNYSGKTTLSRIIRALELGQISNKYENPEFEVSFTDSSNATHKKLSSHAKKIRVFNDDFVRDNLKFIINPDDNITPFAILGGNTTIEEEIKELKKDLGEDDEGNETGLYKDLKNATSITATATQIYKNEDQKLNSQLNYKATNNPDGIKYKSEIYGDQNYTKPKLELDITAVLNVSFIPLTDDEVILKSKLLKESINQDIQSVANPKIDLQTISNKAKKIIVQSISSSDKIEQLVKDSILNRWVKEGRLLHKDKLEKCSLCGNDISVDRWKTLDSHFDEESEKLEEEIDLLIKDIETKIISLDSILLINKNLFYSKYHLNLDRLNILKNNIVSSIKAQLNLLKDNLQERKNDLLHPKMFNGIIDCSKRLEWCWKIFENYRIKSNTYTNSLSGEQNAAKKSLRLREISDFVKTIKYVDEFNKIGDLKNTANSELKKKEEIKEKIKVQLKLIESKERLTKDEEKGAIKVNEYLNNFFGHDFLKLQALEGADQLGTKKVRFEIIRNGKKAHHLSEGECSLISFCYFMAKLDDIETKGSKPIIWIDDPISSLDGNHIFFVYSLINSEIVAKQEFEQLFVSTHNLDFLKYLKRLPGALNKNNANYFIISRENDKSKIKQMPRYLKDYVTEFNFLFHQIYQCAIANPDDENQHGLFYNFGNNTRKFLEAFLFYKYPNTIENDDKLTRFFGENKQASSMTERINNEFSHLEGLFEKSMIPIDIPEMKKTASFILNKIKEKDNDQFEALLISIGVKIED